MKASSDVRPSPIAGQWYPANPKSLAEQVDSYIQSALLPDIDGKVVAVMAPHAGHRYSGPVAGYAFATLQGMEPDLVAVISPMHYPFSEPLLSSAHRAYATPLGEIPLDEKAINELHVLLEQELGFGISRVKKDPEHSLEIELPFLQRVLKKPFHLLPIMVRDQHLITAQHLGTALARVLQGHQAIMVASSDLSHFYPQSMAKVLDGEFLHQVEAFDPQGVMRVEEEGKGFACGRAAVAAMLWAAKDLGADHVQLLNYATSGDITGDYSGVVGYGAAVVTRSSN